MTDSPLEFEENAIGEPSNHLSEDSGGVLDDFIAAKESYSS